MDRDKILLVDDDLNVRETIMELLIYENYDVKTASNGQEALLILEYWSPDLIISDIIMPVMDGDVLLQIVKENQFLTAVPFVFLTAKKEDNLMRKSLLNGVDDFISKPFKISELMEVIKAKIDRFKKIKNAFTNLYVGKKNNFLHEINTPLNNILGSIDLLIEYEGLLEKSETETFYNSIKVSGERLNRTMQKIISYQNLKSNTNEFSGKLSSEIVEVFLTVQENFFKIYEGYEKRIIFDIDKANLKISEKHLQFILFELMDNALKFSSDSKVVIISGQHFNNECYELVIRDFGIGFSEEELKKIGAAQQFNREEREQQGLGLGLFLSKIIIKKADGKFSIVSKINEGTAVKIILPLTVFESLPLLN